MVIVLSYIIAVIITLLLAIFLYPLSALFFVIGKMGYVMGKLADFIFRRTNSGIKKLCSDIKHTKVVRDYPSDDTTQSMESGEVLEGALSEISEN